MKEAQILDEATRVIIKLRHEHGYTKQVVANLLDTNISGYIRIELGKQKVTLVNLIRLGELYNISLTDLVTMIETPINILKKAI